MRTFAKIVAVAALAGSALLPVHAKTYKVAIAGWGPHPTLDETIAGFKQGLAQEGFKEGENLEFDESNVNFDRSLIPQMLNKLVSGNPDLMATIATPVSLTAIQQLRSRTFPIVFTPIADPVHAGMLPGWEKGEKLLTGSSVALDYDAVLGFFKKIVPNLKRLGVLYDTGDDSSSAALDGIKPIAEAHGISLVLIGVDNPSELPQRVQSAVGRVDALYPVASGRIQQGAAAIASTADRAKLPVLTSVPQMVQHHQALAALAVSFRQSGEAAGRIAARLLKGEKAENIPAWKPSPEEHHPMISEVRLKALGLTLPESLKDCNCVVSE
ncbi:ABC transporter substrate-binding protein [Pusillimonas noertemannii]|uniref:ABC transporter substrate-binding protein n=1 Tax=Pusillimonas noertemannii TaxID=305977 RepID=UPI00333F9531